MSDGERKQKRTAGIYVEDALILIAVAALFWLGVFHRTETWAQRALIGVLIVMGVVFVRRIRRVHRAFRHKQL